MNMQKIKSRNLMFRFPVDGWELNLHVILGRKYNYVVDTGLGSLSVAPIQEILSGSPLPVVVINTHHHWDHVWGNHAFAGSTIIAHPLCRQRIAQRWDDMLRRNGQHLRGEAQLCLPDLVFEGELYFPDDSIRLLHTPGHTLDSISVLDEVDSVLDAGDNIGDDMVEIVPSLETNPEVYRYTLARYRGLAFDTCLSGHNVPLGRDVLDLIEQRLPR